MKKKSNLLKLVLPLKKINLFITSVLFLGIISGSIFLVISSDSDKISVVSQIETFFNNIASGSIDDGLALKNSLIINYLYVGILWILGLSMVGVIVNVFLTYIKGFILGFSLASIFLTFGYKGIIATLLYTFPSQILNIIVILVLAIYSIMFALNLSKIIFSKKGNNRLMLKKYFVILIFGVVISFISSLLEVYLFPNLLKLVISFYIN